MFLRVAERAPDKRLVFATHPTHAGGKSLQFYFCFGCSTIPQAGESSVVYMTSTRESRQVRTRMCFPYSLHLAAPLSLPLAPPHLPTSAPSHLRTSSPSHQFSSSPPHLLTYLLTSPHGSPPPRLSGSRRAARARLPSVDAGGDGRLPRQGRVCAAAQGGHLLRSLSSSCSLLALLIASLLLLPPPLLLISS